MTLLEHLREWWTTRNQAHTFGPMRCSIHTGPDLTELHNFTIDEGDVLELNMTVGRVVSVAVRVPAATPRGAKIMNSSLDDTETAFVRLTYAGAEQWLRMQSWTRNPSGTLTAQFSREYPARRWNPTDGYHVENLLEPSPPVPFDEHHPHYDGSAQQELARRRAAAKATE